MSETFEQDIAAVGSIKAIPTILDIVCRTTGMRFAAVARVTEDRWIACSVRDDINFGLKPGGELKVETTICHEIRQSGEAVIIDHVAEDPFTLATTRRGRTACKAIFRCPSVSPTVRFLGRCAPSILNRIG